MNPRALRIYGYMVVFRHFDPVATRWVVDADDEYAHLPAHYLSEEEALDRVRFLRSKGLNARIGALTAEPDDTAEEFEANRLPDGE